MDNKRRNYRGQKQNSGRHRKTQYERRKTREEVQKIKEDLISYAKTPWGKGWIKSLLKKGRPFRMQRGIDYANDEERIDNVIVKKGEIFATVQGTSPSPYRVRVNFDQIPEENWTPIVELLKTKIIYFAQLLDGMLPPELINEFERNHVSIFPDFQKEITAECSCPDQAIPCKHIAALILYLSKVIDFNPFILLKIRGKSKDELLANIKTQNKSELERGSLTSEKKDKTIPNKEYEFIVPVMKVKEINKVSNQNIPSEISFKFRNPKSRTETLENLGLPNNLENPKVFGIILERLYRQTMTSIYNKSQKID